MNLELVTTDCLETGDRVLCHGRVFRLLTRNAAEGRNSAHDDNAVGPARPVIWFTTELVETINASLMPQDWATHWTVQGNERARWSRIA